MYRTGTVRDPWLNGDRGGGVVFQGREPEEGPDDYRRVRERTGFRSDEGPTLRAVQTERGHSRWDRGLQEEGRGESTGTVPRE